MSNLYSYSILRAVHPVRGESVNLGVVLVAQDGSWSAASSDSSRLERLGDLNHAGDDVAALVNNLPVTELNGLRQHLPEPHLTKETLQEWSRDFGGIVQFSSPRDLVSSDDSSKILYRLQGEYLGLSANS